MSIKISEKGKEEANRRPLFFTRYSWDLCEDCATKIEELLKSGED